MKIREELPSDIEDIWFVNSNAFESDAEANMVNTLRDSGCHFLSLVAESKDQIIGHILFTPVELTDNKDLNIAGLAPMAVLKQFQNKGIGSKLVNTGLEYCRKYGYDAVAVLGHPKYYPRFGFLPASKYGIQSEYDVPDDAFMILELVPGCLNNRNGIIKYNKIFNAF